jgi:hypothetical protein
MAGAIMRRKIAGVRRGSSTSLARIANRPHVRVKSNIDEVFVLKTLIPLAILCCAATPALAQNDSMPVAGRSSAFVDAPAARPNRAVTFTAAGVYADLTPVRLIDVIIDADADGDGANDEGLLRITCNGGDTLSGVYKANLSVADDKDKPKTVKAAGASPLANGKTFKGRWVSSSSDGSKSVTIAGGPDVCA